MPKEILSLAKIDLKVPTITISGIVPTTISKFSANKRIASTASADIVTQIDRTTVISSSVRFSQKD
jgi:hypothetical protein